MDANGHAEAYREVLLDLAKAKSAYRELRTVAEYHKRKAGLLGTVTSVPALKLAAEQKPEAATSQRFRDVTQVEAAESILRETGRPMKTAEIAEAMLRGGYQAEAKKLRNALFTGLGRKHAVFEKVTEGTWALRENNGHAVHE